MLAYYNTLFSGLVKVKVVAAHVTDPTQGEWGIELRCVVTAKQGAYEQGAIIYQSGVRIVPRHCVRRSRQYTGRSYFLAYSWANEIFGERPQ